MSSSILRVGLTAGVLTLGMALSASAQNTQDHAYTAADVAAGSQLYARQCQLCHGQNGDGITGIDLRRGQFRSTLYEASLYATVEAIGSAAVALLLWYGGGEVVREALTFGSLVAFLEYTNRFFGPLRDLSGFYAVLQAAMASLERLFGLLDTRPAITSPAIAAHPGIASSPASRRSRSSSSCSARS